MIHPSQAKSSQDAAAQAQRVLDEARLATDGNSIRVAKVPYLAPI